MDPRRLIALVGTAALLIGGAVLAKTASTTTSGTIGKPKAFRMTEAAPSIEALVDRFLHTLEKKDGEAMHRLRVTETEYRTFFIPGSVPDGHPPQILSDKGSEFFWGMLNTKSLYGGDGILRDFGGHAYTLKAIRYVKGVKHYAWYDAYRTPLLTLENGLGLPAAPFRTDDWPGLTAGKF